MLYNNVNEQLLQLARVQSMFLLTVNNKIKLATTGYL